MTNPTMKMKRSSSSEIVTPPNAAIDFLAVIKGLASKTLQKYLVQAAQRHSDIAVLLENEPARMAAKVLEE